jgi:hypothetical protein
MTTREPGTGQLCVRTCESSGPDVAAFPMEVTIESGEACQ